MGGATEARFMNILEETLSLLRDGNVPHLVIGGIASAATLSQGWSAPCSDIDVLIQEGDSDRAFDVFSAAGFCAERTDPTWIYKVAKPDITVDLIWRSRGDIRLDDEMLAHSSELRFFGIPVEVPGPEDLLLIKSIADVDGTSHFEECLRMIGRLRFDWDYLIARAEGSVALRLTSLMTYAMSEGIWVPPQSLDRLWGKLERPMVL